MLTPMMVLLREAQAHNFAIVVGPGGPHACQCDMKDRVVYLGRDLDEVTQGIVGLHELGHKLGQTVDFMLGMVPVMLNQELRGLVSDQDSMARMLLYATELGAWAWAESKMPPGYEKEFQECRAYGLISYVP